MNPFKLTDVTQFLKDMIELSTIYSADAEGYVVNADDGELGARLTLTEAGESGPLLLFQEELRDPTAFILNPLAEGLGVKESTLWFNKVQRTTLLGHVRTLAEAILTLAVDENERLHKKPDKKKPAEEPPFLPPPLVAIAAAIIAEADAKMLDELRQLFADKDPGLITIYWQRRQMVTLFNCGVFGTDDSMTAYRERFPSIRKKTWPVLQKLLMGIFGMKEADDYTKFNRKANPEVSCARLSSYLNTLFAIWSEINPLLDLLEPPIGIDLSRFHYHTKNLGHYAELAGYMVDSKRGAVAPVTPHAAVVPGTVPNQLPPNISLVPGPMLPDGRPSAPIPVVTGPWGQPGSWGGQSTVPTPQHSVASAPTQTQVYPPMGYAQPPAQQYYPQQPQAGYYGNPNNPPFSPPYHIDSQPQQVILPPGSPGGYNPRFP